MSAARSSYKPELRQPFFASSHSPTFEQLELDNEGIFDGITGQDDLRKEMTNRPRDSLTTEEERAARKNRALDGSQSTTPLSDEAALVTRPLLQRNRRLAVDLAFDDERPSAWMTTRRVLHNLWLSLKMMRLFLSLAWTDIKARTCSYCLGFFSVLVVVLLCVLMISLLTNMPILFLRLSEATRGEYDLSIGPGGLMSAATGINYTMIREMFPESDSDYGLNAPRYLDMYNARTVVSCPAKKPDRMWYNASGVRCYNIDDCMKECFPNGTAVVRLVAIDTAAEKHMGLGTNYNQPTPNEGEVILSHRASILMGGVSPGDKILLYGNARPNMQQAFVSFGQYDSSETMMPFRVISIVRKDERKFPGADAFAVVSFHTWVKDVAKGLGPGTSAAGVSSVSETDLNGCATAAYFIMNPATRLKVYGSTSYNRIRSNVVAWASGVLSPLGFVQIGRSTPQLSGLYATRLLSVFLGLIMSVILLALAFLSIVLIYTLLTVGIETKTYELGIQRMVGLTKENLIVLVLANAYSFTIPAWIIGIGAGQGAYVGVRLLFVKMLNVELPLAITGASIGWATLAGLGIPIVASFFPIIALVTQQLPDAINTTRSRNSAIVYKIQRGGSSQWSWTLFGLGILFFAFGFLIYYLFPTALIQMNLSLIFYIFFGVLIGLLAGFVILAMNFERVMQTCVSYLLLFWESKAVFSFMQKSLSAHRGRNRKTSLMYALSLAFVIFITVAVQIQLISFEYASRQSLGCEVYVDTNGLDFEDFWVVQDLIEDVKDVYGVTSYTYEYNSPALWTLSSSMLYSLGRFRSSTAYVNSLPPNYFDVADSRYLYVDKVQSDVGRYGLMQALYSPDSMYKGIMSSGAAKSLGVGDANGVILLETVRPANETLGTTVAGRTTTRPVATLDTAPVKTMSKYSASTGALLVSIPGMFRQTNSTRRSVFEGNVASILLRMKDPSKYGVMGDLLVGAISAAGKTASVTTITEATKDMATAGNLLNLFFIVAEIMILVICFFSLMSSMTTNVLDSSKEIGVLLCMGMSHFQVYRVYVWEAFVLVVSAGIMGLLVGLVVAYTMQLQNVLFTQLTLPFPFPYVQLAIVVAMGFVSALASSISPVAYLLGLPSITHILRRTIS